MDFVVLPGTTERVEELGGKAAALAALQREGLPVPAWFTLTPAAFAASLGAQRMAELASACAADDPTAVDAVFAGVALAPEVRADLDAALASLCLADEPVAVRSSAVDEDGARHSFAGQLDSYLTVVPGEVAARIIAVWRSGFAARVLAYRRANGLAPMPLAPAVLVQRMVAAEVAGVAFSADPVSGRHAVAVVSAVAGLGDALVSGAVNGVTYRIARDGAVERPAAVDAGGGEPTTLLSDQQVRAVAELARRCERCRGRPQDIEWALAGDTVYLLQSRAITTLAERADPDGAFNLWDNSNIAESYSGVTTPLTFSFALHVYEHVYRQLCRILGAPASIITAQDNTFRHMLGLIRGRVYYNLLSWYRLLALLPGFTVNRRFMEQMMGVKEGLPASIVAQLAAASWRARLADTRRLALAVVGLLRNYLTLPRRIRQFHARLDRALAVPAPGLSAMCADELVAYYRDLERQLITRWDAPLLNDLFAMIFYGLSRSLAARWCGDAAGTLQNDLISAGGGMISAEPAARVREMARLAASDAPLVATLRAGSLPEIERALAGHPMLATAYANYLARFADRCLEELKLESPTLRDDPLPLLRAVGHLASRIAEEDDMASSPSPGSAQADGVRARAERRVALALARHPLRRLLFAWVLRGARRHVRARENLRFERTRVYGLVRLIFVELGRRFAALGLLDQPRDIFYLAVDEILGYVEGTATCTNLAGLIALRRAEFDGYRALRSMPPPADRFATHGIVYQGNTFRAESAATAAAPDGECRAGIGCYPGVVRGRVRVVRDPRGAQLRAGEILVAERTDPGWIMLFPSAAGVLVERGSLLSHSAIVARELGIPTIVSLSGVTSWLADGDDVELDGASGVVVRLASPATAAPSAGGAPATSREAEAHV